jgi:hypothetical protein
MKEQVKEKLILMPVDSSRKTPWEALSPNL